MKNTPIGVQISYLLKEFLKSTNLSGLYYIIFTKKILLFNKYSYLWRRRNVRCTSFAYLLALFTTYKKSDINK